ncbi:MAG: hypothetical protein R3C97_09670 [Geminicoccaceae bacterium]
MNIDIWRNELFDIIKAISNKDELQMLWYGSNRDMISSYDEDLEHLFGLYNIEKFALLNEHESKINKSQNNLLKTFIKEIDNFEKARKLDPSDFSPDIVLINSSEWKVVMHAAKRFINSLA